MYIFAVETSCDDSAVAILEDSTVIAEIVYTQSIHAQHGGVVPEVASRQHLDILPKLAETCLKDAGLLSFNSIDVFAATAGPGLVGTLLVGLSFTKALAWSLCRPFLGINHLAAHLHTHYAKAGSIEFPAIALLVSGGHTCLLRMNSWADICLLGSTRDDAAGEAFDKTAKLIGLGYPGGQAIDKAAREGNATGVRLPSPLSNPALPEFSFSGLKTAVRMVWEKGVDMNDLCASFQKTVVDILVSKLLYQAKLAGAGTILAAGGVSANSLLRSELAKAASKNNLALHLPELKYTTDNAVMVGRAASAWMEYNPNSYSSLTCNAFARWQGTKLNTAVI